MKDYYAILGLEESATEQDIRNAYRELSKKFHPDVNNGNTIFEKKFQELNEAYSILGDNNKKASYDAQRKQETTPNHPPYNYATQTPNQGYAHQQQTTNQTVYNNDFARKYALKELAIVAVLVIVSAIIGNIFTHSSYYISKIRRPNNNWSFLCYFVVPMVYCGWKILTYFGRFIRSNRIYIIPIQWIILSYIIKLVFASVIGMYAFPFYLAIYILIAIYPDIISKVKIFRYFVPR